MKIAMICCLLVFYTIKIVHADLTSDLKSLYNNSVKEVTDYASPSKKKYESLLTDAKNAKRNTNICEKNFTLDANVEKVKKLVETCVDDATKDKNFKKAQTCAGTTVTLAKTGIDLLMIQAGTCIDQSPKL